MSHTTVKLSWQDIDNYCANVATKISESDHHNPDMIISIGRGGMIPARILSDMLDLNKVHLFGIKLYKGIGTQLEEPVIENFDVDIAGKEILLVDDLVDSGDTMRVLVAEMSKRGAKAISTVALLKKKIDNSYDPDYYSEIFEKDEWIIFPWELHEFKVITKKETTLCRA